MGTLVDMFDPRFFEVCEHCGKRAYVVEGKPTCKDHPEASYTHSYVLNAYLDDGSDNIILVLFRNHVESLLGKTHEELLKLKDDPGAFQDLKQSLLGSIIKVEGRLSKNDMFERTEFIVNSVDMKPDPKQEVERLKAA